MGKKEALKTTLKIAQLTVSLSKIAGNPFFAPPFYSQNNDTL